jgi:hypothetical protein
MSTLLAPEVSGAVPDQPFSFDVAAYLDERDANTRFVMAEFGHDAQPVAYRQPQGFTGNRAYIGFEAWLRDPYGDKQKAVRSLHERYRAQNSNIYYHTLALGGMVRVVTEDGQTEKWFEGEYNPRTPLSDNSIDEVFIGNVFGDHYVKHSAERSTALLNEAARIVTGDGVVIIRETITPVDTRRHLEELFHDAHMTVLHRITPEDTQWDALQERFSYEPSYNDGSYYLFLRKNDDVEALAS